VDRRRTFAALLIAFTGLGASAADPFFIKEALWTVPERRVAVLTYAPAECLTVPANRDERALVALGRTVFQSPLLLGGQAARSGLSCASCHRNGRGNPDFFFPGLSKAAGTADVTSSLMSRVRGDGHFNPTLIPDLALDRPKISRSRSDRALRVFIRGLVVEEFDGREPPARILDGLTAYVRALDPAACAGKGEQPITAAVHIGALVLETAAARQSLVDGDPESARLALTAVRHRLGQMAARYPAVKPSIQLLVDLDRDLARIMADPATEQSGRVKPLDRWTTRFSRAAQRLQADEPRSLYEPERLRQWLGRNDPA
jgi:hypothetical protein